MRPSLKPINPKTIHFYLPIHKVQESFFRDFFGTLSDNAPTAAAVKRVTKTTRHLCASATFQSGLKKPVRTPLKFYLLPRAKIALEKYLGFNPILIMAIRTRVGKVIFLSNRTSL